MAKDPINRRYIRVVEPWGGGHTPFDTGFGNRLLHFDACYALEHTSSTDHHLELQSNFWYESKYLEFPGARTKQHVGQIDDETQWLATYDFNFKEKTITENSVLGNQHVLEFLNLKAATDYDLPKDRYSTSFDWKYIDPILERAKELKIPSALSKIKIKDHQLRSAIRQIATGCVGLHIRRGNGVYKSAKDYAELPDSVRENEHYTTINDTIYKYWNDSKYARVIKEILEYSENQKFYISCDLLESEYEYLKDKFKARIFTRKDVINKLPKYLLEDINFNSVSCKNRVALESVIDMMCLAGSNFILGAPHSTWLHSIQRIKPVPFAYIHESKDSIIRDFTKSLKNYTTLV